MDDTNWRDEIDAGALAWITPSTIGNCVEVAPYGEWIVIRDSKEPGNTTALQRYTREEMSTFINGAKTGFFDGLI